jgi:integrase
VDGCADCERYLEVIRNQARALAEFADDAPPWAPSLAIVYWLYGPTRWHEPSWPHVADRLRPLVNSIGDLPAQKLNPLAWGQHLARRRTEITPRGAPPKDHTLNIELMRAKEMLNWAVANRMVKFNPLAAAKGIATDPRRYTALPPTDIDRLLAAADDVVDRRRGEGDDDGFRARALRAFVLACHDSMLRLGEARALRHDRIGGDGRVELARTKGGKRRVVFLTPRTLGAIGQLPRDRVSPYVFTRGGEMLSTKTLARWFRSLCELTGMDAKVYPGDVRVRPHDLRASGATTADEHGARPTAIRDALGHRSLATTEIYLRSAPAENSRHVADVMSRVGPKKVNRPARKILTSNTRA